MTPTIIQLPDDLHARARALARTTGRTLEEVLTEAVAQGLRASQAGHVASPDAAEDMWNRLTVPGDMATEKDL